MVKKLWIPDRQDIIWIDCNPQVGQEMKDVHPFLEPNSFDWRLRGAKPHPLGKLNSELFAQVCDRLNQIIQL